MIPLSTLIVSALIAGLAWRAERLIRDYWARTERVAAAVPEFPPLEDDAVMPTDLIHLAMNESESWARESMLKVMRDLYARTRNWDTVRQQIVQAIQPLPDELN